MVASDSPNFSWLRTEGSLLSRVLSLQEGQRWHSLEDSWTQGLPAPPLGSGASSLLASSCLAWFFRHKSPGGRRLASSERGWMLWSLFPSPEIQAGLSPAYTMFTQRAAARGRQQGPLNPMFRAAGKPVLQKGNSRCLLPPPCAFLQWGRSYPLWASLHSSGVFRFSWCNRRECIFNVLKLYTNEFITMVAVAPALHIFI